MNFLNKVNKIFLVSIGLSIFMFGALPVYAQEITLLGGAIKSPDVDGPSYTWQFSYGEEISSHFAWSLSWLNEGHFNEHHRDGQTLQVWAFSKIFNPRLRLAAGVGPYLYFATESAAHQSYKDAHGWGTICSLSATWQTRNPWLVRILVNYVLARSSFDTTGVLMGAGYRFNTQRISRKTKSIVYNERKLKKNEITFFIGKTILNSFESEDAVATAIEYRRIFAENFDFTLGWIHNEGVHFSRRNCITAQIWPTRRFLEKRLSIGMGLGIYVAADTRSNLEGGNSDDDLIGGLVTMSVGYNVTPRFLIRLSWNRTVTNCDRDTDNLLAGLGRRF